MEETKTELQLIKPELFTVQQYQTAEPRIVTVF